MKTSFNNYFLFIFLLFFVLRISAEQKITSTGFQEMGTGETDGYYLVWQDLFDQNHLDESRWLIEINGDGGGNSELQYYRRENVSVGVEPETGKKCLIITARKENYQDKVFTSARINTQDKMSFTYGKLEASMKLPQTGNGLWPAFWMLGADHSEVSWPKSGEIDILEMGHVNGIKDNLQHCYFNGACHWGTNWDRVASYARDHTADYSLQEGFHLYTFIWDTETVKMYLDKDKYPDAKPYFEMNINDREDMNSPGHYFNKPFFVVFNMAVGGHFTGITGNENANKITALNSENNFKAHMYVDFVRLYQKGSEGEYYTGPDLEPSAINAEFVKRYRIYPNPAVSELTITGPDVPAVITIYNSNGQEVAEFYNTDFCKLSELPLGNYLLRIEDKYGYSEIHQLLKK